MKAIYRVFCDRNGFRTLVRSFDSYDKARVFCERNASCRYTLQIVNGDGKVGDTFRRSIDITSFVE